MDDFLYIIIGVGWLIWTVYSNKQKLDKKRMEAERKKALENTSQTQQSYSGTLREELNTPPANRYEPVKPIPGMGKSVFDEIFGEFSPHEEAQQEVYVPEIDEKSWQKKMDEYSSIEAVSLEEIKEEVQPDYFSKLYSKEYSPVTQGISDTMSESDEEWLNVEIHEDFDIKRAIIYNEILRAPYTSGGC